MGDSKVLEKLELWHRDPVECVQKLMGNPMFKDLLKYAPEKAYLDSKGKNHIYDEMWAADWWWNIQQLGIWSIQGRTNFCGYQEKLPIGSMVAPIILSSDKTQLLHF